MGIPRLVAEDAVALHKQCLKSWNRRPRRHFLAPHPMSLPEISILNGRLLFHMYRHGLWA